LKTDETTPKKKNQKTPAPLEGSENLEKNLMYYLM
jgi:hypothetical protein